MMIVDLENLYHARVMATPHDDGRPSEPMSCKGDSNTCDDGRPSEHTAWRADEHAHSKCVDDLPASLMKPGNHLSPLLPVVQE